MRVARCDSLGPFLIVLLGLGILSCYTPDLATQVYQCDRGKCPDGLYCIDGKYCTQQVDECAVSGLEVGAGMAACIGTDPKTMTVCSISASNSKCNPSMQKPLCSGIASCDYCCQ